MNIWKEHDNKASGQYCSLQEPVPHWPEPHAARQILCQAAEMAVENYG